MVELARGEWGDWLLVEDGRVVAVHVRWRSDADTRARARRHAQRLNGQHQRALRDGGVAHNGRDPSAPAVTPHCERAASRPA
jgi:heme-degrading monooxygenase HmoA